MNGRDISFTFGSVTLNAGDYSVTAKDKLLQLAFANGIVKTIVVGKIASQIKISGKLPADESRRLINAFDPLIGKEGKMLILDGASYSGVTLDECTVKPSRNEGFAQFELVFHF